MSFKLPMGLLSQTAWDEVSVLKNVIPAEFHTYVFVQHCY